MAFHARLALTLGLLAAFALSGCGVDEIDIKSRASKESESGTVAASTPKPVTVNESVVPQDFGDRCIYDVERDSEEASAEFAESLAGTWVHRPKRGSTSSNPIDIRDELHFKPAERTIALTKYNLFKDVENMTWSKICVSKPLDESRAELAQFRLVELVAEDGSGFAALFQYWNGKLTMSSLRTYPKTREKLYDLQSLLSEETIKSLRGFDRQ